MITYVIIGVTVVVSYICFGNHELFRKLAFIPYCTVHNREWYRLITHGFVHADMTHLLVNMFTFWSFGTYMESAFGYLGLGTGGYLGLYFGGMVAASLYDLIRRRNDPYYVSIGASGAVSAVSFRQRRDQQEQPTEYPTGRQHLFLQREQQQQHAQRQCSSRPPYGMET